MSEPQAIVAPKRKRSFRKWLVPAAGVLLPAWLCFLGYINWAMHQPPEVFGQVMARMPMPAYFVIPFETLWSRARKGHVAVGDIPPHLAENRLEVETPVHLDSLCIEKPVVLVFESYT